MLLTVFHCWKKALFSQKYNVNYLNKFWSLLSGNRHLRGYTDEIDNWPDSADDYEG